MCKKLLSVFLICVFLAGAISVSPIDAAAESDAAERQEEAVVISDASEPELHTEEEESLSARELFERYSSIPKIASDSTFSGYPLSLPGAYERYVRLYGEEGFIEKLSAARDRAYTTKRSGTAENGLASTGAYAELSETGKISWSFSGSTLTVTGSGAIEDDYCPWYEYRNKITTLKIGEGVTYIGRYTFNLLENMTELQLPSTLRVINEFGFIACESIKKIDLPGGLQEIGRSAFSNCSALESIRIPDSVTKLDSFAFQYDRKLTKAHIGSGLVEIGDNPFCDTSLTDITLSGGSSLKLIDGVLFDSGMKLITYPTLREDTSYAVPKGTVAIGAYAFYAPYIRYEHISYLESVTLPATVTSIGASSFYDCNKLKSVNFPSSIKEIGRSAFSGCESLQSVKLPEGLEIIDNYAFSGCQALTSFKVPDSVRRLGSSVLWECENIRYADIGDGPEVFDGNPFLGAAVQEIRMSANSRFRLINNALFDSNMVLISYPVGKKADTYYVPDGTTAIGESAFEGSWDIRGYIKNVVIPDSVTSIGKSAFAWAEMESIKLGNGVEELGDYALEFGEFTSLTLPDSLTRIGNEAISGCFKLTSITLSKNVKSIGKGSFSACYAMSEIKVASANPYFKSVNGVLYSKDGTVMYQYPDGKKDTSFTMPDAVETVLESAFYNNNYPEKLTFSKNLKTIAYDNFTNCDKVKELTFPDSLVSIGSVCFDYLKSLEKITFGKSLTTLSGAFYECNNLKSIYFTGNQPDDMQYDFSHSTATVYYPLGDSSWKTIRRGPYHEDLKFKTWDASTHYRTDISSAGVILSSSNYTYDGTEKKPSVTVNYGSKTLKNGVDYKVTYSSNINAGSASLTVEGIGDCYGTITKKFTISKASQTVTVSADRSELRVGEGTNINAVGIGMITYSADTPSVASVSSYGYVTAKAEGTARFTVTAAGNANYYSSSKTLTLTVRRESADDRPLTIDDVTFGFTNSRSAFGYPYNYRIPLESYKVIHSDTNARNLYNRFTSWGGNCYGFHVATALFNEPDSDLRIKSFNSSATKVRDLKVKDYSSEYGLDLTRLLEAFLSVQYDSGISKIENSHVNRVEDFLNVVEKCNSGAPAVGVGFRGAGGHEITAYGLEKSGKTAKVKVYNNWYVGEEEYMEFKLDSNGKPTGEWSYPGTEYSSSTHKLDYIEYCDLANVWANRRTARASNNCLMIISSDSFVLRNSAGDTVAEMVDGNMESCSEEITEQVAKDLTIEGHALHVPAGEYTVKSLEDTYDYPLIVSATDKNQSATVVTQSDEVTLMVDDIQSASIVKMEGNGGEEFAIRIDSDTDYTDDKSSVIFNGKSDGYDFAIGTSYGNYINCDYTESGMREDGTAINLNNFQSTNIKYCSAVPEKTSYAFTGSAIEPGFKVTDEYENALVPEVDYTVVYTDNIAAGEGKATIYGINDYKGSIEVPFTIVPADIVKAEVAIDTLDAAYNGNQHEPEVSVSLNGVILTRGEHYQVSYKDNTEVGKATVTISGIGSLRGSVNRTFNIYLSTKRLLGDVNADNEVGAIDAALIARHLADIPIGSFDTAAADTDGNGAVTLLDVTALQFWLARLNAPEGIGSPIG